MKRISLSKFTIGSVGILAITTLLSRLVGFGRWLAQGAFVGSGEVAGAYALANQVPNIIVEIVIGGALTGIMIPILAGAVTAKRKQEVNEITSALFTWVTLMLTFLAVIVFFLAPSIAAWLPIPAGANIENQLHLITVFLQIFTWQLPLYGVALVLGGVLQAQEKFFWPAITPLFSSLVTIASFWGYHHLLNSVDAETAVQALAWGTTAGVLALSLPLFIPVWLSGVRLRPSLAVSVRVRKQALQLGGAGVLTLIAQQTSVFGGLLLMRKFGDPGTVAIFQYGQAIYMLPYALLIFPVVTAFYPRMASLYAAGDLAELGAQTEQTLEKVLKAGALGRAGLLAATPVAVAIFSVLTPVSGMRLMLYAMAFSMIGYGGMYFGQRVFYALGQVKVAATIAVQTWALVMVFQILFVVGLSQPQVTNWTFISAAGEQTLLGMGLGFAVGLEVAQLLYIRVLSRLLPQIQLRRALQSTWKFSALTLCAGFIGAFLFNQLLELCEGVLW